jgi:hypothetical protein
MDSLLKNQGLRIGKQLLSISLNIGAEVECLPKRRNQINR